MKPEYPRYAREVRELLAKLENDGQDNQDQEPETQIPSYSRPEPEREVHFIFIREQEEADEGIIVESDVSDLDTAPLHTAQQLAGDTGSGVFVFGIFLTLLCLFSIAAQVYQIVNPFSVTVSLQARSQQITLQGTLALGRILNPITLSQSQSTPTTGHGHQDAKAATGFITFYNGLFSQQTVAAGTILTGNDGVQVITDADANIPPANPPSFGQATVSAHVTNPGSRGNIAAYDIDQACCATAIKAVNTIAFSGGLDERNFQTVAKSDIANAATSLQATVTQGINAALQGQLKQGEELQILPCSPSVTPDHQIGQEATQVKITVSETCSSLAYNDQELTAKVMQLLIAQAGKKFGAGYDPLDAPQITITQATPGKQVTLSFTAVSTWVYGMRSEQQQSMKKIIAGKSTQQALQLLSSLPGIESASLTFSGFGDASRLPKEISNIHLMMYVAS